MIKWLKMLLELAPTDSEGADTNVNPTPETPTEQSIEADTSEVQTSEEAPPGIELGGETYTHEQLKEWRQGYLRQSDYTKKTQEIASMRQQNKDALELYEYMQSNPELVQQLAELDSGTAREQAQQMMTDPTVRELSLKIHTMEIDSELNAIKAKAPDVDEIRLLEIATENGITVDKAYHIWRGENFDTLLQEELKAHGKKISEKMASNTASTSTLMNPNDSHKSDTHGLGERELAMCKKLDMTPAEYAKYKTYKR